jgi:flagellar basal body-associated protein FliL
MATPEETGSDTSQDDPQSDPGAGSGMKGKLIALAIVLVIVLAECAVAILAFPSANDTATLTQAMLAAPGVEANDVVVTEPPAEEQRSDEEAIEIDLGEFDVSSYQPLSNTTLRISFHLYGIVTVDDETQILDLLEAKRQRMREQVLVILRSAELTDLADAALGLIKRRILEKTNRTFGEPLLREIIFSDFSFMEQ